MKQIASQHRQQGFSLVEMMIASTIGLLLISGVLSAYVSASKSYRLQEAMSQVQESGRFILRQVAYDFRNAGFGLEDSGAIQGYADAVSARADLTNGELLSGDRITSEIVHILPYGSDGDDDSQPDDGNITYYVANFIDKYPTLYRYSRRVHPRPQPWVEGVAGISAEYGVDDDNDKQVDSFKQVAAMMEKEWPQVVALRLSFLITSIDQGVVAEPQILAAPFDDTAVYNTDDRRLYRIYTTTLGLRNRLL